MTPLLKVEGLNVRFRQGGAVTHAVRNVSFEVGKGETVALEAEMLLVAVGRAAVIGDCGLDTVGLLVYSIRTLNDTGWLTVGKCPCQPFDITGSNSGYGLDFLWSIWLDVLDKLFKTYGPVVNELLII